MGDSRKVLHFSSVRPASIKTVREISAEGKVRKQCPEAALMLLS